MLLKVTVSEAFELCQEFVNMQTTFESRARTLSEKLDAWQKRAFWMEQALMACLGITDERMHDTTLVELCGKLRESR